MKGQGRRPEGVGKREPNQILLQELAYVLSSIPKVKTMQEDDEHTNKQWRNDPLEVTNATEKQWDQLDTRLARYGKNRKQMSG
jgi:hypothetical protein